MCQHTFFQQAKRWVAVAAAVVLMFSQSVSVYAQSLPVNPNVTQGQATFNYDQTGQQLVINQQTADLKIDWGAFNIGAGYQVIYQQPNSNAWSWNFVSGGGVSQLMGSLLANGGFALFNPAGILIGAQASIKAANFLASTLNVQSMMNDQSLNKTIYTLMKDPGKDGFVVNQGRIEVTDGGEIVLVSGAVRNEGVLLAKLGRVTMSSGEKMTLEMDDKGLTAVVIDQPVAGRPDGFSTAVENLGDILADGGVVTLSAKTVKDVFQYAINNEGVIRANQLETKNGEVYLSANDRVHVSGTIEAQGGKVQVDSEGADYDGTIRAAEALFNAHNGDTFISGTFAGDMTWTDNINIFVSGDTDVMGDVSIVADADNDGTGYVSQDKDTALSATGDVSIEGSDLYLSKVFFGGAVTNFFTGLAKTGEAKIGHYTDRHGNVVGDGRIISALSGLQIYTATSERSGEIHQAAPDTEVLGGNKINVSDGGTAQQWGWFEFDLDAPELEDAFIESGTGTITLESSGNSAGVNVGAYYAAGTWSGDGFATWNNRPAMSVDPIGESTIINNNDPVTVDFTGELQGDLLSAADLATVFVKRTDGVSSSYLEFWTEQAPATKNQPVLSIKFYKMGAGNISLTAQGNASAGKDITLGQLVTKGNVDVQAVQGAILDANTTNLNIVAGELVAQAARGIDANVAVQSLSARNTDAGDIFIRSNGDLQVADLAGFGGLINEADQGKIVLENDKNLTLNAMVETNAGDIVLSAVGGIQQNAGGDIVIYQADTALGNAPANVHQTDGHNTSAWQSGISNDNTIDVAWELPESIIANADYTATTAGTYTMASGASVTTNGGDATITANGDAIVTLVDAGTGNVSISSTAGSVLDGDGGSAPADHDVRGRTITLSAPLGSTGDVDIRAPLGIGFSLVWGVLAGTLPDAVADSYTTTFSAGAWHYAVTSPALPDSISNYFHVVVTDGLMAGAAAHLGPFYIDTTAPTISAARASGSEANVNGWNNTDVTVEYAVGDGLSGVLTGAPSDYGDDTVTTEGLGQSVSGIVYDLAGNYASATLDAINIDKTAPTISAARASGSEANVNGWNNTDVTVEYAVGDGLSGVLTGAPSDYGDDTVTAEGLGQSVSGIVYDLAGNYASATLDSINIDKTAPTISAARASGSEANVNGWNNTDVTVEYAVGDGLSGVLTGAPSDYGDDTVTAEGLGQSVSGIVYDLAGNYASATLDSINIDKTAPTISAARALGSEANVNGWNNTDVTVQYTVGDGLSGVLAGAPSDYGDDTVTTEGLGQSVSGIVYDLAGNYASATLDAINIDKTAPTISAARASGSEANVNGWNNTDVTVQYTVGDGLSGVLGGDPSDYGDDTVMAEGLGQSVSGIVYDLAGNYASATLDSINIDKTAPTISAARAAGSEANVNGWNNTDVTVQYTVGDGLSGVLAGAPSDYGDDTVTTEGLGQSVSGIVYDLAGNYASATLNAINIDKTAPRVSVGSQTGTQNTDGTWSTDVSASFDAIDTLSGFAPEGGLSLIGFDVQTTAGEGPGQTLASAQVCDMAGNCSTGTGGPYAVIFPVPSANVGVGLLSDELRFKIPAKDFTENFIVSQTQGPIGFVAGQVFFYHPLTDVNMYETPTMANEMYEFIDGNITRGNFAPPLLIEEKRPLLP